jgi:hypothetical protein
VFLQRLQHQLAVVALHLDHAVFRRATRAARRPQLLAELGQRQRIERQALDSRSAAASAARPLTTVTVLPPRPLVDLETRTTPSAGATVRAWRQTQLLTGWRQSGHIRPASVE